MAVLPLAEAAVRLDTTPEALRKRIARGTVGGRKRRGQWVVDVGDATDAAAGGVRTASDSGGHSSGQNPAGQEPGASGQAGVDASGQEAPGAPQTALLAQRAQEMAAYTRELQAPLLARLEAQAEEIGALKERLAAYERSEAQGQQGAPPAPEGRPWWKRWFVWNLSGA